MSNCCSNFHMSFCPCPWMKRNIRLGWQFQSDKNYAIDSAYSVLCKSLDCARFHCGPHHRTEMIVEGPFEKIDFWFILAKHFFGQFFFFFLQQSIGSCGAECLFLPFGDLCQSSSDSAFHEPIKLSMSLCHIHISWPYTRRLMSHSHGPRNWSIEQSLRINEA